jgi:hypothetical protein
MKPLLLTVGLDGPDGPFAGMVMDHAQRHIDYCNKFGYKYIALTDLAAAGVQNANYNSFFRMHLILKYLKDPEYSHVIWLDADTIIANTDVDLRWALPDWAWLGMTIHPYADSEDSWHWQSGVMYIRSCRESITFFERVLAEEHTNKYDYDQSAMHGLLLDEPDWQRGLVTLRFPWNNTLHDQPQCPIIAAFHGNGNPHERRAKMRYYVHQCLRKIGDPKELSERYENDIATQGRVVRVSVPVRNVAENGVACN